MPDTDHHTLPPRRQLFKSQLPALVALICTATVLVVALLPLASGGRTDRGMIHAISGNSAGVIANAIRKQATPSGTTIPDSINFPTASSDWLTNLERSGFVKSSTVSAGPAIPDAAKWYYIRPTGPIDPKSPRPMVVQNPLIWNFEGAAVGFDDGSSQFLTGNALWSVVEGALAAPDHHQMPPVLQSGDSQSDQIGLERPRR